MRRPCHHFQVKKDYVEGMTDTLDLVVIGAWWGNGRKAGWYSPFLVACYNPETETLESVCKVHGYPGDDGIEYSRFTQLTVVVSRAH